MSLSYADTVTDEDFVERSDHDCRASQCTEPHGEEITVEEQCPKCGGKLSTSEEAFGEIVICETCKTHKHVEEGDVDDDWNKTPMGGKETFDQMQCKILDLEKKRKCTEPHGED